MRLCGCASLPEQSLLVEAPSTKSRSRYCSKHDVSGQEPGL